MRSARCEADESVARGNRLTVDDLVVLHDADAETGEVVVALRVKARHLGRFSAGQGAAREFTAFGDALDDAFGNVDVQCAGGIVVEKQERLGAGNQDVVDAHSHQILADLVMAAGVNGEFELGADAVRTGDEDWPLVSSRNLGERRKAAEATQHFRAPRGFAGGCDTLNEFVTGVDVDTGVAICQSFRHGREV